MAESSILTNSTYLSELRYGWVPSGQDRGTLDIVWSSLITVTLCCWVATHPNAGSPRDKFYHPFVDRAHLAMVGLLGPEFLLAIALGQFSSARRSVKKFATDDVTKGVKWTYTYAFFTDMGGMLLTSPDYPEGFPINAEQLHYLVKYGHVDIPDMEQMNIGERNASDNLSRFLTLWQALWFFIIEMQRIAHGLPMTTLELTALSYVYCYVEGNFLPFSDSLAGCVVNERHPTPLSTTIILDFNSKIIFRPQVDLKSVYNVQDLG